MIDLMPAAGLSGETNGTGPLLTSDGIIPERHLVPSPGGSDGHIWPRLHVEVCGKPLVQASRTRQANVCFDFWLLQVKTDLTLICSHLFSISLIQIWPWWIIAAIIAAHTHTHTLGHLNKIYECNYTQGCKKRNIVLFLCWHLIMGSIVLLCSQRIQIIAGFIIGPTFSVFRTLQQPSPPEQALVAAWIWFKTPVIAYSAANGSGPPSIRDAVKPYTSACPLFSALLPVGLLLPQLENGPVPALRNNNCLWSWTSSPVTLRLQRQTEKSALLPQVWW